MFLVHNILNLPLGFPLATFLDPAGVSWPISQKHQSLTAFTNQLLLDSTSQAPGLGEPSYVRPEPVGADQPVDYPNGTNNAKLTMQPLLLQGANLDSFYLFRVDFTLGEKAGMHLDLFLQ